MNNQNHPINIEEIWRLTDGGRVIIEDIYPQSSEGFLKKKNFKLRSDDKQASASVFKDKTKAFWFIQDKGGADTKAKNAITLLQEEKSLSYFDALKHALQHYGGGKFEGVKEVVYPEPKIEKTGSVFDEIQVKEKDKLSAFELQTLGDCITADHCSDFNLSSLDFYITKTGTKIISTDTYPIYYYNYGSCGKIYQPYSKEYRFIYVGKKPEQFIFSDKKTAKLLAKVDKNIVVTDDEEGQPERLPEVIICTGPSDALTVYSKGFRVVWFNSETALITDYDFIKLTRIAQTIYNLPDIDTTGIRQALRLGVKFLEIKTIWLPESLKSFKDWKGKPCKDIRDFFRYYIDDKYTNLNFLFKKLIDTAIPLQPWIKIQDDNGDRYEISNEHTYQFLSANGFFTIATKTNKKEFTFCRIIDHIVEEINEDNIVEYINRFMVQFLRENLRYWDIRLINAIHRTSQLKLASITKIKRISLDFKSYGHDHDHLFFANQAVRVTAKGIETYKITDTGKYVFDYKVINHHYTRIDDPATVIHTPEYKAALEALTAVSVPSPEYKALKKTVDEFPEIEKYNLEIKDQDFSIIKYLYNTGRVHWKKEESGVPLTEIEKKEHDLHFISKVAAIGYSLYRYKEPGMAYSVYAMETEQGSLGSHRGGTGKSFLFQMVETVRKLAFIDGQKKDLTDNKHIFSEVVKDVTDFVYFDDVAGSVDLHVFMPAITGKMEVEPKFVNKYTLAFPESPKLGITSNHPVRNMDPSLKRRLWFIGFSSYYHTEDKSRNVKERSMRTEFGKNLITDFTTDEMNRLYNFMVWCMHIYMKFRTKINPPMEDIEKRNLQQLLGDDFIYWADEYFTDDNLNVNIDRAAAFETFLEKIPERDRRFIKPAKFKEKLKLYAERRGWYFNPDDLIKSETERERNDIRVYMNGKDVYCFHFRTPEFIETSDLPF